MQYNNLMKKICDICGSSGQLGGFRGVSRFMITWEECPECLGTGETDTSPPADTSENCDDDTQKPGTRPDDQR
jgi:DnaJ-class molecular chaperone